MNVKEVFCNDCFKWKKREDLVEAQHRGGELYCEECGNILIHTDDYNPKKERKYTIRLKGIDHRFNWLMYDTQLKIYVLGAFGNRDCQTIFTERELAKNGLVYMLYNDAFEVREVEE